MPKLRADAQPVQHAHAHAHAHGEDKEEVEVPKAAALHSNDWYNPECTTHDVHDKAEHARDEHKHHHIHDDDHEEHIEEAVRQKSMSPRMRKKAPKIAEPGMHATPLPDDITHSINKEKLEKATHIESHELAHHAICGHGRDAFDHTHGAAADVGHLHKGEERESKSVEMHGTDWFNPECTTHDVHDKEVHARDEHTHEYIRDDEHLGVDEELPGHVEVYDEENRKIEPSKKKERERRTSRGNSLTRKLRRMSGSGRKKQKTTPRLSPKSFLRGGLSASIGKMLSPSSKQKRRKQPERDSALVEKPIRAPTKPKKSPTRASMAMMRGVESSSDISLSEQIKHEKERQELGYKGRACLNAALG